MKKLEVGDRVAVYNGRRVVGTILKIDSSCEDESVFVDTGARWIHPKQCRKLKPKNKPEPKKLENPHIEETIRSSFPKDHAAVYLGPALQTLEKEIEPMIKPEPKKARECLSEAEIIEIKHAVWESGFCGPQSAERGPVMLKIFELIEDERNDNLGGKRITREQLAKAWAASSSHFGIGFEGINREAFERVAKELGLS